MNISKIEMISELDGLYINVISGDMDENVVNFLEEVGLNFLDEQRWDKYGDSEDQHSVLEVTKEGFRYIANNTYPYKTGLKLLSGGDMALLMNAYHGYIVYRS